MPIITKNRNIIANIETVADFERFVTGLDKNFKCANEYNIGDINEIISIPVEIGVSEFNKLIKKNVYKSTASQRTAEFWLRRGHSQIDSNRKVSHIQRCNSKRCIEYWIKRGYSIEEAEMRVKEIQSKNGKKANAPSKIQYWVDRGKTTDESIKLVETHKNKLYCFRPQFWVDRGYSKEEADKKVEEIVHKGSSLDSLIEIYGEDEAKKINSKKALFGEKNGQYGKPAPKGSGNGISGFYKNHYFRSLTEYHFIKWCENNNYHVVSNDISKRVYPDKISVEYQDDNGKKRTYIPDYKVYIDGDTYIYEIKNAYTKYTKDTETKIRALEEYITSNNLDYKVRLVSEKDFELNLENEKIDFENENLVVDTGKLDRFLKRISK